MPLAVLAADDIGGEISGDSGEGEGAYKAAEDAAHFE